MTDTARLVIAVDSSGAAKATANLDKLDRAAGRGEKAANKLGKAWGVAIGLISSAVIIGATRAFIRQADAMANMNAKLKLVTGSTIAATAAQKDLFDLSQKTSSDLEATTNLYVKLGQSSKELAGNHTLLLGITEKVSKALVISGADAASSTAVIRQFSQAMAAGALRGDEFISVMEGAPRLAQAIADGMGVAVGSLRKLAAEGKLTSDQIIKALEDQGAVLDQEFGAMPLTVGRATQQVRNALTEMIGDTDKTTGASNGLALSISDLARLLESEETKRAFASMVGGIVSVSSALVTATNKTVDLIGAVRELYAENDRKSDTSLRNKKNELETELFGVERQNRNSLAFFRNDGAADDLRQQIAEIDNILAARSTDEMLRRGKPLIITGDSGQIPDSAFRPKKASGGNGGGNGGGGNASDKIDKLAESVEKAMTLEEEWALLETEVYTPAQIEAHNARVTAWANESQEVEKATDSMSVFAEQAARNIQGALADGLLAVTRGKFDEIGDNFAEMLERMLADLAASKLLEAFGTWASGYTGAGSGWINAIGQAFAGGKASGGPVMAGQSYRVGEKGRPEIFTPSQNGTISQAGQATVVSAPEINLIVENNVGPANATTQQGTGPDGKQFIRLILNAVAGDVSGGSGPVGKAISSRFGLQTVGVTRG